MAKNIAVRFVAEGGAQVRTEAQGVALALGGVAAAGEENARAAGANSAAVEAAYKREGAAVDRLKMSLDPLYAAQVRMQGIHATLDRAVASGATTQAEASRVLVLARERHLKFNDAVDEGAKAARRFDTRGMLQQLSQVGQAGAATGNYLQAAAIQGADFGAYFGPLGIVIGTVAGALVPLAANLLNFGDEAETAEERAQAMAERLSGLKQAVDAYSASAALGALSTAEMQEKYGTATTAAQTFIAALQEIDRVNAGESVAATLDEIASRLGEFGRTGVEAGLSINQQIAAVEAALEAAKAARRATLEAGGASTEAQVRLGRELSVRLGDLEAYRDALVDLQGKYELTGKGAADLALALNRLSTAQGAEEQIAAAENLSAALLAAFGSVEAMPPEVRDLYKEIATAAETVGTLQGQLESLPASTGAAADEAKRLADEMERAASANAIIDQTFFRASTGSGRRRVLSNGDGSSGLPNEDLRETAERGILALIRRVEGTAGSNGYNTSLANGAFLPGGQEMSLVNMTLREILAVQRQMLADPDNTYNSSAIGAYQITGSTLGGSGLTGQGGLIRSLGLSLDEQFTPELQDRLAQELIRQRMGQGLSGFQQEWQGILHQGVSSDLLTTALGSSVIPTMDAEVAQAATAAATEATRAQEQAVKDAARAAETLATSYEGVTGALNPLAAAEQAHRERVETITAAVDAGITSQAVANQQIAASEAVLRAETAELERSEAAKRAATDQTLAFQAALDAAGMSAAEFGQARAQIVIGAVDGVADAIGGLVRSGLRDWKGFFGSLKSIALDGLAQLAATFARQRLIVPIQAAFGGGSGAGGVAGAVGQAAGGLPGMGGLGGLLGGAGAFMGGIGTGASALIQGVLSNGLAGGGAVLGSALSGATSGLAGLGAAVGAIAVPVGIAMAAFSAFRKRTEELDAGIRLTITGMDSLVETFSTTRTTRLFGLLSNTSTDYDAASAEVAGPLQAAYREIYGSVSEMAAVLGVGASAFEGFTSQVELSTKGMDEEQALRAVTEALAAVGDELAYVALEGGRFVRAGETTSEALARVAASVTATEAALDGLGFSLDAFPDRLRAAQEMADAAGGPEALAQVANAYAETFYSAGERLAFAQRQFNEAIRDAGATAIPRTAEDFRALVDRLMASGRAADAATVMGLTPLWNAMQDLEEQAGGATDATRDAASILSERQGLEEELWQLQGRQDLIDARRRDAIAESNLALYDQVTALRAQEEAANEARAAMDRLDPASFVSQLALDRRASGLAVRAANRPTPPLAPTAVARRDRDAGRERQDRETRQAVQQLAPMVPLMRSALGFLARNANILERWDDGDLPRGYQATR